LKREFTLKERELRSNALQSIGAIRNNVSNWRQKYTITAPIDGKLIFLSNLSENKFVVAKTPLFAVIPDNQDYIGNMIIPQQGYGKIKVGQKVRVKLDNYPYQEFGQIIGRVAEISLVSSQNFSSESSEKRYFVKVSLPTDLKTTYLRSISYTPEMTGSAEVITDNMRILDRVFNRFRTVLDK